jgi:hypothetical protein
MPATKTKTSCHTIFKNSIFALQSADASLENLTEWQVIETDDDLYQSFVQGMKINICNSQPFFIPKNKFFILLKKHLIPLNFFS